MFNTLAFIGSGCMAQALAQGIISQGVVASENVRMSDPQPGLTQSLQERWGIVACENNLQAVAGADLIILAVKPQVLGEVMQGLHGALGLNQAVLSIVAGARLETLCQGLGTTRCIRVMPNTPARVGQGMCMWTCSDDISAQEKEDVGRILTSVGQQIYAAKETYLDMATALSGSGPAFVLLFLEALTEGGVRIGLPYAMAYQMACQTLAGTVALAQSEKAHPAQLKAQVTSPGGTTAAGLYSLEKGAVRAAVMDAVQAAYERCLELG